MNENEQTTFRITLISDLTLIVNSVELDEEFVQMDGYAEDKFDVVCEYTDYYAYGLLEHEPFIKEFAPTQMEDLRNFIRYLKEVVQAKKVQAKKIDWSGVRAEAANLLASLTRK